MIQSNLQTAEQIATKMGSASRSIQNASSQTITKAKRTNLIVNGKVQEANKQALKLIRIFNESFQQTIENIHSVANEFERADIELQDNFDQLLPNNYLEDWRTYAKAKNG